MAKARRAWAVPAARSGRDRGPRFAGPVGGYRSPVPPEPRERPPAHRLAFGRPDLDPLRACVAVAAGVELGLATERGASSGVVHGAALAASVGRPTWRVPLISCLVATRILELVRLAGSPRRRSLRQTSRPLAAVALWALALLVLGRESARAEAWEAAR